MKQALLLFVWCFVVAIKGDNCNGNHLTLPDIDRRASNYAVRVSEPWIRDYLLPSGWYDVGRRNMPTDPNSLGHYQESCGTGAPIWMNGTIPRTSEGKVNRTVCIKLDNGQNPYDPCYWNPFGIEVINCGTHMLYKLAPAYFSDVAYCFDPSDLSTYSVKVQPWLFFADNIGINGQIFKKPKLFFRCQLTGNMTDDLYYTVSWYVNDKFLLSRGPVIFNELNDTNLHETDLIESDYKLDINIKCVMNTSTNSENAHANSSTSLQFWLGIRVLNPAVNMIQGSSANIQLQPTFPFGCSSKVDDLNPQAECSLSVHMFDPDDSNDCKSSSISVKESQRCSVQIPGFYHHQWQPGVPYDNVTQMTITTRDPNDYNQGKNKFVLKLLTGGTGLNDIVQGNYINNIIVTTSFETSWQAKTCYAYVDPHMSSFDGRTYENQHEGIFVMYRHNSSKQEVQMKTKRCNSVAFCACAVAVRAGGDIFLLDLCRSPGLIKHVSCKENILDVRQVNAYLYKIYMPLGTMVSVAINNWSGYESTLNLNIYPSVKDVHETRGLCGVLNNNQGDDFKTPSGLKVYDNNEFSLSWRLDQRDSFFDPMNHNPDLWDENSQYCVCPAALNTATIPSTSSGNKLDPLCSASLSLSCSTNINIQGTQYRTCNIRTKRSKHSMSKEIERILRKEVVDNDIKTQQNLQKRSVIAISLEEALEECKRFFTSNCTTARFEDTLPNSNHNSMNSSMTNCALDYTYTGNMSLASLHCETYRSEVAEEIGRNSTFREANPEVVESFRTMACINNCNNNGDCVNGSCICRDSYIEEDCSVSLSNYPAVEDTYSGGLCQKDEDDCCGDVPIYGSRFVKGITKQRLEIFNIYLNGTIVFQEPNIQVIPILNPFEAQINVPCHRSQRSADPDNSTIPFILGTRVSLSNDGRNYGPAKSYYILDSKCQGILNDTNGYTFYLQDGTCFISGTCYSAKEEDALDKCNRCQPTVNRFYWTYECTRNNDPLLAKDQTPIIISVCIATLVIVLVIVITSIVKCCLKKEQRIAGNIEINVTIPTTRAGKFDKTLLFCSQQNLRNIGTEGKENSDDPNNAAKITRPGNPGSMSFQKIFLDMELHEN
ncbi:hypothetical protein CHS0354_011413 [Potamilus streckersoni]|uniref:VWFD domain-containing protein n=1 Tax=Potamilus streckersoni TaxID=2493646 RepID=A0AAE0WDM6_9BIVA|nr:hypothetical protein CHS0354_011413 [Potamilus streckersoni]